MFGIGGFELFLIVLFAFLIFGPDKLPKIANTVGKAINRFRNAQTEMNRVIKDEVYDPNSDEPFKNPINAIENFAKGGTNKAEAKQESFSERKAKYDRERAAKQAVEEQSEVQTATKITNAEKVDEAVEAEGVAVQTADTVADAAGVAGNSAGEAPANAEASANSVVESPATKSVEKTTKEVSVQPVEQAAAKKSASMPRPRPTADELYGTKSVAAAKSAPKTTKSVAAAKSAPKTTKSVVKKITVKPTAGPTSKTPMTEAKEA